MASGQGLESLGLSALARRATEAGVPAAELEGALDGDAPRLQLHRLVLEHASRNTVGGEKPNLAPSPEAEALRIELSTLRLGQLQKRAVVEGVGSGELEEATDSDAPTKSITELIVALHQSRVERTATAAAAAAEEHGRKVAALEAELNKLKLSALQKRAASEGVSEDRMSEALDSDSPKNELVALLVAVCLPVADVASIDDAFAQSDPKQALIGLIVDHSALVGDMPPVGTSPATVNSGASSTESELAGLRLGALQSRAASAGVEPEAIVDALDHDNPKPQLIALIVAATTTTTTAAEHAGKIAALERELGRMRLGALQKRAQDEGVAPEMLEDALDADKPKQRLIELLVQRLCPSSIALDADRAAEARQQEVAALMSEIQPLKLGALKRRAREVGVEEQQQEEALDADDARQALIELILAAEFQLGSDSLPAPPFVSTPPASKTSKTGLRPHHSAGVVSQIHDQAQQPQAVERIVLPGDKWVMLSYNWDVQDTVTRVRIALQTAGLRCWMDIDGGVDEDIFDSMAAGVSGSSVVMCFMTQKCVLRCI